MDFKLELVLVPVSDVDRAKAFYTEKAGFHLDVDHRAGDEFRVVQLTPSGSACSIAFGTGITDAVPGSVKGLHLVVSDIETARAELVDRGVDVSEIRHLRGGRVGAGAGSSAARLRLDRRFQRSRRQQLGGAGGEAERIRGMTRMAVSSRRAGPQDGTEEPRRPLRGSSRDHREFQARCYR